LPNLLKLNQSKKLKRLLKRKMKNNHRRRKSKSLNTTQKKIKSLKSNLMKSQKWMKKRQPNSRLTEGWCFYLEKLSSIPVGPGLLSLWFIYTWLKHRKNLSYPLLSILSSLKVLELLIGLFMPPEVHWQNLGWPKCFQIDQMFQGINILKL
jgi:hypothetical protein